MRIGELARRAGVSIKAVRYYERIGLIEPVREDNGYRSFADEHVRAVAEIRELSALGIPPQKAGPFVECLDTGHEHGDECVSSLAVYRDTIAELDRMISSLSERRDVLRDRLERSAGRTFDRRNAEAARSDRAEDAGVPNDRAAVDALRAPASIAPVIPTAPHRAPEPPVAAVDYTILPEGLPVPLDDGAADHLPRLRMPGLVLPTSDGGAIDLASLGPGRTVLYLYPLTGRPGVDLPEGWDAIPGARGCSTQACDFRDHFQELRDAGVERVFGMSSQDPAYQAEVVERLRLPFAMISDEALALADALRLPTFRAPGHERLYSRLTLVVLDGAIEHVFYPIFPPNAHARAVLGWLREHG